MEFFFKPYFIGVVAFLIGFNNFGATAIHTEDGLELLFRQRTNSDWRDVWHSESHSRCRDKLVRQLYWACEKDIYRLTRRQRKRTDEAFTKRSKPHAFLPIWLQPNVAYTLLRTRRSAASSITRECCTKSGCTWEEYAEYCPSNKRRDHYKAELKGI